jgi:hypothetical protein
MANNQDAEVMVMLHSIRFWKQKAFRMEQQLSKERQARKELEQKLERYTCIPEDLLKPVLEQTSLRRLDDVKEKVSSIFQLIGLSKMLIHKRHSEALDSTEEKIKFWQNIVSFYKTYEHDDELERSEEEIDKKIE